MKIALLFIYSDSEVYKQMRDIQRTYIHKFENVHCYFIEMREMQLQPVTLENDVIYVRGKETILNILHKTLTAIDFLLNNTNNNYDFFIRTNVSTIINIPKLLYYLSNIYPKTNIYTGAGKVFELNKLDEKGGIVDTSLFGTKIIPGTNIIFSADVARVMSMNKDKFRQDIIDDVSMSLFIQNNLPSAFKKPNADLCDILYIGINTIANIKPRRDKYIFYRNHNVNRNDDIKLMKYICNVIYANKIGANKIGANKIGANNTNINTNTNNRFLLYNSPISKKFTTTIAY